MKKIFIFLLVITLQTRSQVSFNSTPKYLDKNYAKARINTVNNKFWAIGSGPGNNSYEVPRGRNTHAQFANSLWIGGYDAGGQLHISANTYRQVGNDFWPGPLDTTSITTFSLPNSGVYNKLWKVDCDDINNFLTAYLNGSIASGSYTVPTDIATYPAIGIAKFQKKMEPFYDLNNNGKYNPATEGDYPLIKGHQQILSIYNDRYATHGETYGAPAMGIEIHEKAYAYFDPNLPDSMQAVNYSTFYHYTIYNRSNTTYTNVFISDWSDVDLGYYPDDFIGTDSLNNFTYAYNADNFDETMLGYPQGYGSKPPVVSHAIIKTPFCTSDGIDNDNDGFTDEAGEQFLMDRSTYYYNNTPTVSPAVTIPTSAVSFYRLMSGSWVDGTPFTYGGNGYGGTIPSKYVYTGNPGTNTGWTEGTAGNVPEDARVITSSGPFTFPANSKIEWSFAVIFSQDTTQNVNTITQFNSRVRRDVKNVRYYENLHQAQPECHPATTIGLKEQVGNTLDVLIYPNPASRRVIIRLPDNNKQAGIRLIDVSGRLVKQTAADANADVTLNISDLAPGVYFVEVNSGNLRSSQKLIKD